jgi:hypothetical protein
LSSRSLAVNVLPSPNWRSYLQDLLSSSSSHTGLAANVLGLHLLLIDVSSKWMASASAGVSKVCASSQESHRILNLILRAATMYVTRSESMRISSSTDTIRYCLLNHKFHRRPTNGGIKTRNQSGMASDKSCIRGSSSLSTGQQQFQTRTALKTHLSQR